MTRAPLAMALALMFSTAVAQVAPVSPVSSVPPEFPVSQGESPSSDREDSALTHVLPNDFEEIHRALDGEALRKTGKHLLQQPFELELLEKEARATVRNPKTGKKEEIRVQRAASGGCC
jgi:hypothetical protein